MRFDNVKWDRSMTSAFGGLNRHERIGDGEWSDLENLTVEEYPVAKVRPKRQIARFYYTENNAKAYRSTGPRLAGHNNETGIENVFYNIADVKSVNDNLFLLDEGGYLYREGDAWTGAMPIGEDCAGGQMAVMGRDLVFKGGAVFRRPTEPLATGEDVLSRVQQAFAKVTAPCTIILVDNAGEELPVALLSVPSDPSEIYDGLHVWNPDDGIMSKYVSSNDEWVQVTDYDRVCYYDYEKQSLYRYNASAGEWQPAVENHIKLKFDFRGTEYDPVSAPEPYSSTNTTGWKWKAEGGAETLFDNSQRNDCISLRYPRPTTLPEVFVWIAMNVALDGFLSDYIVEKAYYEAENSNDYAFGVMILRGLYVPGLKPGAITLSVERRMPKLDFITEHKNRIWGCRYGLNDRGEFVNEIFASALGDPLNWFRYEGTAADSYTASVGTGEAFTGIAETEDYVLFFKQDRVYLLSGDEPGNFRLREVGAPGVQNGSHRSVAQLGGFVYYKSDLGVMKLSPYNQPTLISERFGPDVWHGAIAGTDGRRVYFAMKRDEDEKQEIYVYDTFTGMWTKEDGFRGYVPARSQVEEKPIAAMIQWHNNLLVVASHKDNLFYHADFFCPRAPRVPEEIELVSRLATGASTNSDWEKWHSDLMPEEDVAWYGVTGLMGLKIGKSAYPYEKRVRQIMIRLKAEAGTLVRVSIMLDENGQWLKVCDERRQKTGSFTIRYAPAAKCDMYRLKFEGEGDCVIYSIEEETEYGGEN